MKIKNNGTAKSLGYKGEKLAQDFLKNKGFKIIGENFTIRGGEIDIVAKKDGILIFVEVKTRTDETFGHGDESVNSFKRSRMARAISRYIERFFPHSDPDYRMDIIEIKLDKESNKVEKITHFEDVEW